MRKMMVLGLAMAAAVLVAGCTGPMKGAVGGSIILGHKSGGEGFDNDVTMAKRGVAEAKGILFYVSGDASIKAAMDAGGITKIHHIDYEVDCVLGIITTVRTVVYGE